MHRPWDECPDPDDTFKAFLTVIAFLMLFMLWIMLLGGLL